MAVCTQYPKIKLGKIEKKEEVAKYAMRNICQHCMD